jgi:hypothetical protein
MEVPSPEDFALRDWSLDKVCRLVLRFVYNHGPYLFDLAFRNDSSGLVRALVMVVDTVSPTLEGDSNMLLSFLSSARGFIHQG